MPLDLFTLYIVILLNSATLTVLWLAIWRYYPSLSAAKAWMSSNLATTIGGAVLSLEGPTGSIVPVIVGNVLVIFGFCLFWVGVRQFHGRPPPWMASVGLALLCLVALVILQDSRTARNTIYTIGQSLPLLLAGRDLLPRGRRSPGGIIAATAMLVAVAGNAIKLAGIVAHDTGALAPAPYATLLFCTMLGVIFSGLSWNFGFLLIVIDHLRSELASLVVQDELTGLPNRRKFLQRLAEEEARARRTGRAFSLIVLDMDDFKSINDTLGHAAGDAALIHLGRTVGARVRSCDLVARLGGDEFCIVLPEASAADAALVAGDLAKAVQAAPLTWQDRAVALRLSMGIAEWSASCHRAAEDLLQEADAALYEAKRSRQTVPPRAGRVARPSGDMHHPATATPQG